LHRQGLVMGITAAGNSGTVLANLLAPRLANIVGWHNVLGIAMVPLAVVLVAFLLMAKDSPPRASAPFHRYLGALTRADLWWFCLFYSATFGGYVGLSSFLPLLLRDQYGVTPVTAGYLTGLAAFIGSGARPIGGYLADKVGGVRLLTIVLLGIACFYLLASRQPALPLMVALLLVGMACLGTGNGAVFQLVPRRFSQEIGVATGIVGALGGLGGFLLPILLGSVEQATESFSAGFLLLALSSLTAVGLLRTLTVLHLSWRGSWRRSDVLETVREKV